MKTITLSQIETARQELKKHLPPSPLLKNAWLSEEFDCELYLKLETMQPIGSFKIRGATFCISQLSPAEKRRGVIAASAGNHAHGVAWGSRLLGIDAQIVMPKNAPLVKVQNTRALGAEVILDGENYDEACQIAKKLAAKKRKKLIHAFDDPDIIAGQGTVGLEILDQLPDVEIIVGSIGGGGLLAGCAIAVNALRPRVEIWGCQAAGAPSMVKSLKSGRAISLKKVETFADGIAVRDAHERLRKILSPLLNETLIADDEAIAAAILLLIEKAKIVAEGAGALPLAVLDQRRKEIRGKKVVTIVSGGNLDVNILSRILDRGLIRAGRRLRVNVWVPDKPGSLANLTAIIASEGANILQAIHDRSEPSTTLSETEVELTLETKGPDHSEQLLRAIHAQGLRMELMGPSRNKFSF